MPTRLMVSSTSPLFDPIRKTASRSTTCIPSAPSFSHLRAAWSGVSRQTVASEALPLLSVTTSPRCISTAAHFSRLSPPDQPDDVAQNHPSRLPRLLRVELSAH